MSEDSEYRHTFTSSPIALRTLANILTDLCHFGCTLDPDNQAMIGEYNVGVNILAKIGVFQEDNVFSVINALVGIGGIPPVSAGGKSNIKGGT